MTRTNYADEIQTVKSDLRALKDDVENLSDKILDDAQTKTKVAKSKAKARYKFASDKLADQGARSKEKISGTVASNPFASLAATAGAGLAIGAFLRR